MPGFMQDFLLGGGTFLEQQDDIKHTYMYIHVLRGIWGVRKFLTTHCPEHCFFYSHTLQINRVRSCMNIMLSTDPAERSVVAWGDHAVRKIQSEARRTLQRCVCVCACVCVCVCEILSLMMHVHVNRGRHNINLLQDQY